jgi:hypothetical protein
MHNYDGGCGRCGKHKGEFLGKLPHSIWSLREEIVKKKFAWYLDRNVRRNNMISSASIHLCDKCWEKWKSPVRVNWREILNAKPTI